MAKQLTYKGRHLLRDNSLTVVLFAVFLLTLVGQITAGYFSLNQELRDHQQPTVTLGSYVVSGHFLEALFENWESEFLQMGAYILLTAWLFQRGSAESRDPDEPEDADSNPKKDKNKPDAPWPVRRGGWVAALYAHSLSLAMFTLFFLSFAGHAAAGAREYSREQALVGQPGVSTLQYIGTSQSWFESFQNWQSEFFSIAVIVVLSIFLRERRSPESKPVAAPHGKTGEE